MIDALIAGKLFGAPQKRTSKNGNNYVTGKMRVPMADGVPAFVTFIAFRDHVCAGLLETSRVTAAPAMQRIVVAIDPSGSGSADADECGIIVAGIGHDGHGYVLADLSAKLTPTEWARKAVDAFHVFKADRIVAETNFGALMVLGTIAAVDPNVPTKAITSSRGKALRAEPISAIFQQERAHLVGSLPELEDQLTSFTADYDRARDGSPDRVDALVFALTELMCGQPVGGYFNVSSLLVNGAPVEMPKRISYVLATVSTPSKSGESLGVMFIGIDEHKAAEKPWPAVIVDYDLRAVDDELFERHIPAIYERLKSLAAECECANAGLWVHGSAGIGAAILQHTTERALPVNDIDAKVDWHSAPLADRAAGASRYLHSGKHVKIVRQAHEKVVEHRGVTRNHLLAQLQAFRLDEEMENDELLRALLSGVRISLDKSLTASDVGDPVEPVAPPPSPPPAPHIMLKPGTHVIDGGTVNVPGDAGDLVVVDVSAGRHIVDDKITYAITSLGGFVVG